MAAPVNEVSTPVNTIKRENLPVLITNNVLNNSLEFSSDCDEMETDLSLRYTRWKSITKKLFHSPMSDSNEVECKRTNREQIRKTIKRKRSLLPDSSEKIKKAYIRECDKDSCSPQVYGRIRKRVLISHFHNKEYCMEFDS